MRLHIASDHAGFELKQALEAHLVSNGHDVVNHGAFGYEPADDYPAFCFACAEAVVADPGSLGVVIGGSGNGEQIAANKVRGTRAALVWSQRTARLARQHNDANLAGIGAREHTTSEALAIIDAFIAEAFSGDERHQRRVDQVTAFETADRG
ncbi:MAG: ribose-5-phosphate isomerase [Bifidobacteriaceae bacterium]|jgi:ribose 5-phosphate isomerase B|nr:ribose-5-phosphate isomerase [Bifidobacteriaceae bacterium]